jgi:hypothetical protein
VITGGFCWHIFRTLFLAVLPIVAARAFLVTCSSHPASFAEAFACRWIARRVVLAVALVMTLAAIEAHWTVALALHTGILDRLTAIVLCFAHAATRYGITSHGVCHLAAALEGAVLTELPCIALLLALLSLVTRRTIALASDGRARTVVEAVAFS